LIHIKDRDFISNLAYRTKITNSHVYKVVSQMEKKRLLTTEKEGRTRYIYLTKKGTNLKNLINSMVDVITKRKKDE